MPPRVPLRADRRPAQVVPELMPTKWIVGNFKPIERAEVELRRLVVLAGANSSGKSSLIQSLLFLAQSEPEEVPVLNGPLVGLGEAVDMIRDGQAVATFGCRVRVPTPRLDTTATVEASVERQCADIELSYERDDRDLRLASVFVQVEGELVLEAVRVRESALPQQFHGPISAWNPEADILRVTALAGKKSPRQTFVAAGALLPEALLFRRNRRKLLTYLRDRYPFGDLQSPRALAGRVMDLEAEVRRAFETQGELAPELSRFRSASVREQLREMDHDEYEGLLRGIAEALQWTLEPLAIRRHPGYRRGFSTRFHFGEDELSLAMHYLSAGVAALRSLGSSICYLGPLRDAPRLISRPGQGTKTTPVGVSGEFTADFLARKWNEVIRYVPPKRERALATLEAAVAEWVEYLGVGSRVVVEDQGKLGRSLLLEVDGKERDLMSVGVGASQLLPVVALVLGAPSRSVVLLEQPELHLHPAVQSRLADFLIRARPDLRVVVETHSEYLVSRVRVRVAQMKVEPGRIGVLFVQRQAGTSEIRDLELGPLGELDTWPEGFFDTSEREAADLVQAVHARLDDGR